MKKKIAAAIDAVGELKAQIASLEKQVKVYREEILSLGIGHHIGSKYYADITERDSTAWRAIAETFDVPSELIKAHTTVSPVLTVKPRKAA